MTQAYLVAPQPHDPTPPATVHTHIVRAQVGGFVVETRHYSADDARREAEWRERCGESAEVIAWQK